MQYSEIAKKQLGRNGANRPEVFDAYGRVRMINIYTEIETADKEVVLWHFPAGRLRILKADLKATLASGGTTIQIGHSQYTDMGGVIVAKKANAFQAAVASTSLTGLASLGPAGALMETTSGFDLLVTGSANLAAKDKLEGIVYFVVD